MKTRKGPQFIPYASFYLKGKGAGPLGWDFCCPAGGDVPVGGNAPARRGCACGRGCACAAGKGAGPLGWDFCCPAGAGAFLKFSLGRLRGGRRGGLLGAAAPPRPPLHSPRTTPLGFPYPISPQSPICTHFGQSCWAFQLLPACEGCASFAAGASLPSVG